MNLLPTTISAAIAATGLSFIPQQAVPRDSVPLPAATQNNVCGPRADIVSSLGVQYHENQQATGLVDPSTVLEIFVSQAGTWTIVATGTDGNSCILFYGEGWDSKAMALGVNA